MNAETREARNWDFAWILDAVGADPTGHLPNCGLDIDTGIACACPKVGDRLSLALAQHDARLVADAERRGAERERLRLAEVWLDKNREHQAHEMAAAADDISEREYMTGPTPQGETP